jgi:hypothetical protein
MSRCGTLGRSESPAILLGQGQHSGCFKKTLFQNAEGSRSPLLKLLSTLFESLPGLLLRVGLKNLIEQLACSVAIAGRRFVQNIPPEVGLADTQCKIKLLRVYSVGITEGDAVTTSLRACALLWLGVLPFSICSSSLRFGS